jgi:hypothetical protein
MMFEPDYAVLYLNFLDYVLPRQTFILMVGLAGSALHVILASLCSALGLYVLMFLLAKVFFELSQLGVCLVSVSSLIFWFTAQRNIWFDAPVLIYLLLYTVLAASAFALYLFDFNYPLKEKLSSHLLLPVIATVLTGLAMLVS